MVGLSSLPVSARISKFIDVYQWLALNSKERVLTRKNFSLKAVHPFANALTIVDISSPDFWIIRLSGTKACERSGQDKTGCDAKQSFAQDEQMLRSSLAHALFENPCGIRALTRETYANGEFSLLDTIALPLLGEDCQRLVVHYAQVVEDIEHGYRCRPMAEQTDLMSYDFVDLGHGVPTEQDDRLRA